MSETWTSGPGRGIWSLHRRRDEARLHFCFAKLRPTHRFFQKAGDEARLHFCFAKIMVRLGRALAANSPQDCWNLFSSRRHRIKK